MSEKSFCVTCGVVRYAAAWRRDCKVSRLPSVIIFSTNGRAAFARVSVVVIRPCSRRFVTRLRSVARRCHGLRPSFDPDLRCRISPVSFLPPWHLPAPQSQCGANFVCRDSEGIHSGCLQIDKVGETIDRPKSNEAIT